MLGTLWLDFAHMSTSEAVTSLLVSRRTIAAPLLLRHSFCSGTVFIAAQFLFRHSFYCGTVLVPAQFLLRHSFSCGTVLVAAQFFLRHSSCCGTVFLAAQFLLRHNSCHDSLTLSRPILQNVCYARSSSSHVAVGSTVQCDVHARKGHRLSHMYCIMMLIQKDEACPLWKP
jgi:hypothetical protein